MTSTPVSCSGADRLFSAAFGSRILTGARRYEYGLMKRFGLVVIIAASAAFLDAPAAIPQATVEEKSNTETFRQLDLFAEVFERVRSDYVEEVSDETLVESAIN